MTGSSQDATMSWDLETDCEELLTNALNCSNKFIQRVEKCGISKIETLLWLTLGPLHDKEPDFCDMLRTFHHEDDEYDLPSGSHSIKGDLIKLYCFLHLFKGTINPRLSEYEDFDYRTHFKQHEFNAVALTRGTYRLRAFKRGLGEFIEELQSEELQDQVLSQASGKPETDPRFAFTPKPERTQISSNHSVSSKRLAKSTTKPSKPPSSVSIPENQSSSTSSSDEENSGIQRLKRGSAGYTKEPKFTSRSPVDTKHVFTGAYKEWDETANFLRAYALGRNMGHLVTEDFLSYYQQKLKKGYSLDKIYRKYHDEDNLTIRDHQSSLAQFKSDIRSIYSAILSVFRKNTDRAILTKHKAKSDGLSAWLELHAKYDNKGAAAIAADENDLIITEKYHKHFPGGVDAFLTRLTSAFSKLNELADHDLTGQYSRYSDKQMVRRLLQSLSKDDETRPWALHAEDHMTFGSFDEAVVWFRRKALREDQHNLSTAQQKSRSRVIRMADIEEPPPPSCDQTISGFLSTAEVQAMLQRTWPQELQHLKLSPAAFNCIPKEARLQFIQNRDAIAKELMESSSKNPKSTKGEIGEFTKPSDKILMHQPSQNSRFQSGNLASSDQNLDGSNGQSSGQDSEKDSSAEIVAAFNLLEKSYRDQFCHMGRCTFNSVQDEGMLEINGSTLTQIKGLLHDMDEEGIACVDGCANAGVLSTHTHVITQVAAHRKANLHGANSTFKTRGLNIGTGVTALVSKDDPTKPICLLEYSEACIHDDPTTLYSCYQMRDFGIIVDDVASHHKKDQDGNTGTQSLHMKDGTTLPLDIKNALPVLNIRKPTEEELEMDQKVLPRFVLTSDAPWNPKEHHRDQDILATSTGEKQPLFQGEKLSLEPKPPHESDGMQEETQECSTNPSDEASVFSDTSEDGYETALEEEEPEPEMFYFDPSDKQTDTAIKGKAVHLSVDDYNQFVRDSDVHKLLIELEEDVLFGRDQEFDSITYAMGLRNSLSHRMTVPGDPELIVKDPGESDTPRESTDDPQTQKEMVHPVWEPGELTEKPEEKSTSETQFQEFPDIPGPEPDPDPLESEQIKYKFARALPKIEDPASLRPKLGYISVQRIVETLKRTTQLASRVTSFPMVRHFKSRFKWLSGHRINEKVSTDTMFANVASLCGCTCAQVYWGFTSHIINIYGMKKESEFINAHRDFLRNEGIPSVLAQRQF